VLCALCHKFYLSLIVTQFYYQKKREPETPF
jgi:hypothetical protein